MSIPRIPTELIAPAFTPRTSGSRGGARKIFSRLRKEYQRVAEVFIVVLAQLVASKSV